MHVQAIVNQKGGCGKTTTAIHVAALLAREGRRTLLVDLDPQGHACLGLGLTGAYGDGTYEVLVETRELAEVLVEGPVPGLAIAPASISLAAVEQLLAGQHGREARLRQALLRLAPLTPFDEVVIDCPPSLGLLTFNALWAANRVLVPIDPSVFSLDGLQRLCETITLVEASSGRMIRHDAVLTMFDRRTRFGRGLETALGDALPSDAAMLRSRIRMCTRLREAALAGVPITEIDARSNGFEDYQRLTDELLQRRGETVAPQVSVCDPAAPEPPVEVAVSSGVAEPRSTPSQRLRVPSWVDARPVDVDALDGVAGAYGPIPIAGGVVVRFRDAGAIDVKIAGTFNDWQPDERVLTHREEDGTWQKILFLSPGSYEYRLVVNGDWEADPDNEAQVSNPFGGFNSVIHV